MAGKGKAKGKVKKKNKNPWKGILHFTEDGCLYIDDPELADEIQERIESGNFCIQRDDPDYEVVDDEGGGIGGYGQNIQCPC